MWHNSLSDCLANLVVLIDDLGWHARPVVPSMSRCSIRRSRLARFLRLLLLLAEYSESFYLCLMLLLNNNDTKITKR